MKAFKPFEAPQRSVKIKIQVNFYFNTTFEGREGLSSECHMYDITLTLMRRLLSLDNPED